MTKNAIPAEYEGWIDAAASHLVGALDNAIDELSRDRDFLNEDDDVDISPTGDARWACREEAIRKALRAINDAQEG